MNRVENSQQDTKIQLGSSAYLKVWFGGRGRGGDGADPKCRINRIKVVTHRMEMETGHISNT
jgi:hypothetical protein